MSLASTIEPPRPKTKLGSITSLVADHVALTKPPIIGLLLVTAMGGMFLAAEGVPPLSVMFWLMLGGALAAGGANSINHALERNLDKLMVRTSHRPVSSMRMKPAVAFTQGILFNLLAFVILVILVNLLSALLILGATLFYVVIYTRILKPSTPQNIVIGGAAGSIPPMAGWAAITGGLDLPAVYLFAIIFFWTPPHFWALALLLKDDYARAGVPMLPVVQGVATTVRSIMLYSLVLVALTLLFFTVSTLGWIYLISATSLGSIFLFMAWRLLRYNGERGAKSLYLYSLAYLALIFIVIMIDSTVSV